MSAENPNKIWDQILSAKIDSELSLLFPLANPHDPLHIETNILETRWFMDKVKKANENGMEYLFEDKITQGESQKVEQILLVISVIKDNESIKTTDIQIKSQLSSDSVNRTLKLLNAKKIVRLEHLKSKNNTKMYTLDKEKARNYRRNLLMWKYRMDDKSCEKILEYENLWAYISKRLPKGFNDLEINSPPALVKLLNSKSSKIRIRDLPFPMGRILIKLYLSEQICHSCFDKGDLMETIRVEENKSSCQKCGEIQYHNEELQIRRGRNSKRIKYAVDDTIFRILHQYD